MLTIINKIRKGTISMTFISTLKNILRRLQNEETKDKVQKASSSKNDIIDTRNNQYRLEKRMSMAVSRMIYHPNNELNIYANHPTKINRRKIFDKLANGDLVIPADYRNSVYVAELMDAINRIENPQANYNIDGIVSQLSTCSCKLQKLAMEHDLL